MNRLSEGAIELNDNEVFNNCSYSCYANIADALNILKAYENTGLEPEQIKQLNDAFTNVQKKLAKAFDDLLEYKDLEEQGLLIKLPCKVEDFVFEANINRNIVSSYIVTAIVVGKNSRNYKWELLDGIYSNSNGFNEFALGKTVFTTQEEAEKALKERI
jgi:hypothetical protein